jgi:hypothetical protein
LLEEDGEHREAVFCSGGRLKGEEHCKETGSQKPDDLYAPRIWLERGDDVAHGKALMCRDRRFKLVSRLYEDDEFYDLEKDPGETRNLIHDPAFEKERNRLYAITSRFLLETSDVVPLQPQPRDVNGKV